MEDTTKKRRQALATNRARAKQMRHEPVSMEDFFWSLVRNRQLGGFKFKRQVLIGHYIVDFVCLKQRYIVELDGPLHVGSKGYDAARDRFLRREGYSVLRVTNSDLGNAVAATMKMIEFELNARRNISLSPGRRQGKDVARSRRDVED